MKELLPIVIAAAIWGKTWGGNTVRAQCDNMAVVSIVNSGTIREPEVMHLRCCLAFLEAKHTIHVSPATLRGQKIRSQMPCQGNVSFPLSSCKQGTSGNPRTSASYANSVQAGLDLTELDSAVENFFTNGLAESTQRSYSSAKWRYIHFCAMHGMSPIPTS